MTNAIVSREPSRAKNYVSRPGAQFIHRSKFAGASHCSVALRAEVCVGRSGRPRLPKLMEAGVRLFDGGFRLWHRLPFLDHSERTSSPAPGGELAPIFGARARYLMVVSMPRGVAATGIDSSGGGPNGRWLRSVQILRERAPARPAGRHRRLSPAAARAGSDQDQSPDDCCRGGPQRFDRVQRRPQVELRLGPHV